MKRRAFIALLGSVVATPVASWPLAAQQYGRLPRIGILTGLADADRSPRTQMSALRGALAKLGWVEGRNVRFEFREAINDSDRLRAYADELVRLGPDNARELERAIEAFAAEPNGGLLMVPPPASASNRALTNRLALKYRLRWRHAHAWRASHVGKARGHLALSRDEFVLSSRHALLCPHYGTSSRAPTR